ncbi:MAG: cupin domain-containing protein [Bosea sp. (in: a-proteobacteria)]|uniref:cupin domain-containing protein n=1 Tax=Bosea sp. (in: a-proteobacteria) TaxID=1871050 RepID=UPI003F7C0273
MSLLVKLDLAPTSEPRHSKAAPDRLISGDPSYKTWAQDESREGAGKVRTGVWEATPGENHSIKGETMEFCYILSGVIELTEQGQPPRIFRAGDSFVMKPGFVGVWKTIETVRKIYVIAG